MSRFLGCLTACLCLTACAEGPDELSQRSPDLIEVTRGPLRVSVREGGTLEAVRSEVMRSQVEGRNEIIELVEEGSYVTEGQIVCVLDSGELEDEVLEQEITVDKARSQLAQAQEDYRIQEKVNLESLKQAETDRDLAVRAYEAYEKGTLPLQRKRLESALTVAREELKRAETELKASQRLFDGEIIPKTQLEADELGHKKAVERVTIANKDLVHFNEFTAKDELQKLGSELEVKKIAHARVVQQCNSELTQVQDLVDTRLKNLKLEETEFEKLRQMLTDCTVRSPTSGLVVYARRRGWDKERPISLGRRVYERERLLLIPDLSSMVVQLNIHESSVKRVKKGQRVWVTVDALPGQRFPGTVEQIALVPSSKSSWMNPDLKVYEADVTLDEEVEGIRPGMHAQVEILVSAAQSVLQVPVQCVLQSGARSFVYLAQGEGVVLQEIEVGPNNQRAVEIVSGLEAGDLVYLSPPEGAPPLPGPESREFLPPVDVVTENGG